MSDTRDESDAARPRVEDAATTTPLESTLAEDKAEAIDSIGAEHHEETKEHEQESKVAQSAEEKAKLTSMVVKNKGFLKGLQPKQKKQKTEDANDKPKSKYLTEMDRYKEMNCGEDSSNGRPLVK